jgi:hypothetical protein
MCLSWNDGQAFCRWLSEKTEAHFRMPSEAEWEYACTAGGLDNPDSPGYETGKKNSLGIFNLFTEPVELCLDIWHSNFREVPTDGSAWLTLEGLSSNRVVRGFKLEPQWGIGYSHRLHCVPNEPVHEQGLRLARFPELDNAETGQNHTLTKERIPDKPPVSLDLLTKRVEEVDSSQRYSRLREFLQELILAEKLTVQQKKRYYARAIALTRSVREKSLVVPLMRNVPCIETFNTLKPFLSVPELQSDAAVVILDIIPNIQGEYPDETTKVIELIENGTANDFVRHKLQNTKDYIERNRGRITQWLISKPFVGDGDLFDLAFPPENQTVDTSWNVLKTHGWWGTADLARFSDKETCTFYLKASIYSPKKQEIQLHLKGDYGVKAWLNEKFVFEDRTEKNFRSQPSEISTMLSEGWNHLLLKTIKKGKRCSAYCRISNLKGDNLEGLRMKAK